MFYVLYIITKLELGGAQKICLALAQGLNQLGYNSSLISGADGVLVPEAKKLNSVYLLNSFKREVKVNLFWTEVKVFFSRC